MRIEVFRNGRIMENKLSTYVFEEFTRFGGGQTVFEHIYRSLLNRGYSAKVITDSVHRYLPSYIPDEAFIETSLLEPKWDNPTLLFPKIIRLKKELEKIVPSGITINNHPNVFIYNADVNFMHEFFGFMAHKPSSLDKAKLRLIKATGIFNVYRGGYFLVQGSFSRRQALETFASLGIQNTKIDTVDLPVMLPETVDLSLKSDKVLTFGRISPDKQLEKAFKLAASFPEIDFIVAGRVNPEDSNYLKQLLKIAPGNLKLIPNPTNEQKDSLFRMCKVYFHTKENENYGISVAEAISYGCFPVVPLKGGAYEDVLKNGEYGLGYKNLEEAKQLILQALDVSLGELSRIYASRDRFTFKRFEASFIDKIRALF